LLRSTSSFNTPKVITGPVTWFSHPGADFLVQDSDDSRITDRAANSEIHSVVLIVK
jgi:hypothetical protein